MTPKPVFSIVQMDALLGDIDSNVVKIRQEMHHAFAKGADIVCFPEMSVCGYMLEDKVFDREFIGRVEQAVQELALEVEKDKAVIVGGIRFAEVDITTENINRGDRREVVMAYNGVYLLSNGAIEAFWTKQYLPNYDVFDEKRHFIAGDGRGPVLVAGVRLGVLVCEDCWYPDTAEMLGETGADIILICNASPYEEGKQELRLQVVLQCVVHSGVPCIYLNMMGGQDELVFDGGSMVVERGGKISARLPYFEEARAQLVFEKVHDEKSSGDSYYSCSHTEIEKFTTNESLSLRDGFCTKHEGLYAACVVGLRSFVEKNKFEGVLLGLSGGIDSALTCAIAVDALGHERVRAFRLPSKFTSVLSMDLAQQMQEKLGFVLQDHPIDDIVDTIATQMAWDGTKPLGFAHENIQSRVRGLLLMAESNASGWLLLTTGNKSEMSVGYATIYGDMCGGFSVLKDMYKGTVYDLSLWRNQNHCEGFKGSKGLVIPEGIIEREPSAELRDNQKDTDTLPPYDVLDGILRGLIEREMTVKELENEGFDGATVRDIKMRLRKSEHKRYQAPPGVKLGRRAFGKGWRYPITDRDF